MPQCCVFGCNSRTDKAQEKDLGFHKFPKKHKFPSRYSAWLKRINRKDFTPSAWSVVCSRHFSEGDYELSDVYKSRFLDTKKKHTLKDSAVPSLYLKGVQDVPDQSTKRRKTSGTYVRRKLVDEAIEEAEELHMNGVNTEPNSDSDSVSPPYEPQFDNIKEEHMADVDDNEDETSQVMESDEKLSDTPDEEMSKAVILPIVKSEYHVADNSQEDPPDEGKEELWHITTIKKELKKEITSEQDEVCLDRLCGAEEMSLAVATMKEDIKDGITTEEHQVSLDSFEQFLIKQDYGTASSIPEIGESLEHEWDSTGGTDPLLLSKTSCKLPMNSGSEKNKSNDYELNNKELLIHTVEKPFKCEVCNKCFSFSSTLVIHSRKHTGERPFKCEVCNKSFKQSVHLVIHSRTHSGVKHFECNVCNNLFSCSASLKLHSRSHSGEKPFKCKICNKCFSRRPYLASHLRIHTGEKPFKCEVCNKSFTYSGNFLIHSRVHTGEKPFKCDMCDKCFSRRQSLVTHIRNHTGDKPFICGVCNRSFSTSSFLVTHTRIHTGEKPFKCDKCNKRFSRRQGLVYHSRTHTG